MYSITFVLCTISRNMGGVVAVQLSCNDKALDLLAGPIGMILGVSTHHIEAGTG
jgi:hypothetical protein